MLNKKPTKLTVLKVRQIWRRIYAVKWHDPLNYPRSFTTLYRPVNGQWMTGEDHPTGVYNGGLLRVAPAAIAEALTEHEKQMT